MNNFIFENSSKVYFGEGCVKEYLANIVSAYGDTVMFCYGGGSVKKTAFMAKSWLFWKMQTKPLSNLAAFPPTPLMPKRRRALKQQKKARRI